MARNTNIEGVTVPQHRKYTPSENKRMLREMEMIMYAQPKEIPIGGKRYVSVEDAMDGLGFDVARKQIAGRAVRGFIEDTNTALDVVKACQAGGMSRHLSKEVLTRAILLKDRVETGEEIVGRVPKGGSLIRKGGITYPEGTVRQHGGQDRIKRGGKWVPVPKGKGLKEGAKPQEEPEHAPDGEQAIVPPEAEGPHPEIHARYSALKARGKRVGLRINGKLHPSHTHSHLDHLENQIKAHEDAKGKYAGTDGSRQPDTGQRALPEHPPEQPENKQPAKQPKGGGPKQPAQPKTLEDHVQNEIGQAVINFIREKPVKNENPIEDKKGPPSQIKKGGVMIDASGRFLVKARVEEETPPKKAPPPPPKKITKSVGLRAAHPVNEHGHRDGLAPGMILQPREEHERYGQVLVKSQGVFEMDAKLYQGGTALMDAIYGHDRHGMTARRYFHLGGERRDQDMLGTLRGLMKSRDVLVQGTGSKIALTGDLRKAGVPEHLLMRDHTNYTVLDHDGAEALIKSIRSA